MTTQDPQKKDAGMRSEPIDLSRCSGSSSVSGIQPGANKSKILNAPANIRIAAVDDGKVWVQHEIVPNAHGYIVQYKESSKNRWTLLPSSKETLHSIDDLENKTAYDLRVVAVDESGREGESSVVVKATPFAHQPTPPPEQPKQQQTGQPKAPANPENPDGYDKPKKGKNVIIAIGAILLGLLLIGLMAYSLLPESGTAQTPEESDDTASMSVPNITTLTSTNEGRIVMMGNPGPLVQNTFVLPGGTSIPGVHNPLTHTPVEDPVLFNSASGPLDLSSTVRQNDTPVISTEPSEIQLPPQGSVVLNIRQGRNVWFDPNGSFEYEVLSNGETADVGNLKIGSSVRFQSKNPNSTISIPLVFSKSKI